MLKHIIIVIAFFCSVASCNVNAQSASSYKFSNSNKAKIAIIIDDIGNKPADADAFSLPEAVTFAILPHTDYSTGFSRWASQQGREVMLHMPMESLNGESLGEGAIVSSMYPNQVESALVSALASVPHAVGVNNHMGSKLTQITLQMSSVMNVLHDKQLFFIDSRTTRFTKAHVIAQRQGVSSAQRHIFLDHYPQPDFLKKQLATLIRKARKKGKAIGIAHPYPVSIAFLNQALSQLPDDIELVSVSEYLQHHQTQDQGVQIAESKAVPAVMSAPE